MCKTRFQLRTSDEILNRLEALSSISGESKNSVANVLLALQLGGVKCDVTSKRGKSGSNSEEPKESSVVHDDGDDESSEKCDVTNKKKVSPPKTPSSKKKKDIPKGISKKEKVSLGNGRKPRSFEECLEYFKYRRIPDPEARAREFYDFYEAKGWVMGKSPIKKWSCCLTVWISNNKGWKPIEEAETEGVELEQILAWMKGEHKEWYEKFKEVKNINEIDGYYIDEFRGA